MYRKSWYDGSNDQTSNGDDIYVHPTMDEVRQTSYGPEPVPEPPPPPPPPPSYEG